MMISAINNVIERKEKEFLSCKDTCRQLDEALSRKDLTFSEAYDVMLSGEYKDIVSHDLWEYVFNKYELPFSEFINSYASLDYGDFTATVPLVKREGDEITIYPKFWSERPSIAFYEITIAKLSKAISRLENSCLNEKFSVIDILFPSAKGREFVAAIVAVKYNCSGQMPVPKKRSDMLFKNSRDAFVREIIGYVEKNIEDYKARMENEKRKTAEAKKKYDEIKDDVEKAAALFNGCCYGNSINIRKP